MALKDNNNNSNNNNNINNNNNNNNNKVFMSAFRSRNVLTYVINKK